MAVFRIPSQSDIVVYPESDGQPMAENDLQYRCIVNTRFALEQFYRQQPQVYVGADLLIYYEPGDPSKSVAPDVFVSLGVPKHLRRTYLIWEEGKVPDVVFEFASPNSWRADLGWKRGLYLGLGVREYILFDPSGSYFKPVLQGYCLENENYISLPMLPPDPQRGVFGLHSAVLNLELWAQPGDPDSLPYNLRLYDPTAAIWLPTPDDEAEARRAAEAHAAAEAEARRAAEARLSEAETRLAELQAELERLRASQG